MNKYQGIVLVVCALWVASYLTHQSIEESTIYADEVVNDAFIRRLEVENVPVRVSDNGMFFYQVRHRAEVETIKNQIHKEYYPGRGIHYYEPEREKLFLNSLYRYGIEYRVIRLSDGDYITWSEEDDARVRELQDEVMRAELQ